MIINYIICKICELSKDNNYNEGIFYFLFFSLKVEKRKFIYR